MLYSERQIRAKALPPTTLIRNICEKKFAGLQFLNIKQDCNNNQLVKITNI